MRSKKGKNTAKPPLPGNNSKSHSSPGCYIGRFAPSPTGPLHMGSLVCALASYLDAKANNGLWLVRMEDLDPPRESSESAQDILETLQAYGLHWHGDVCYQSQRHHAYQQAIESLADRNRLFSCQCTRKQLAKVGSIYPGNCRENSAKLKSQLSLRIKADSQKVAFCDLLQGEQAQDMTKDVGDFIIKRRGDLYAYQLAVVVDDDFQNINHVIRGCDLLDSTPRQIYLQQQLSLATPVYAHLPLITHPDGHKLSKQTHAADIKLNSATENLRTALRYLNQAAPPYKLDSCDQILYWSIRHWQLQLIPGINGIIENTL